MGYRFDIGPSKGSYEREPLQRCILGKRNHTPIPKSSTDPKTVPVGHLLSGDIIGPVTPETRTGEKYFFLFVDRRTSYIHAFTSQSKDGFITCLQEVQKFYKDRGHNIDTFRSDSEPIMLEGKVGHFLTLENINHDASLPYEHYQNLIERHVQTIVKKVATIMLDQQLLNATFWNYALFYAVRLWNDTPNSKTKGKTPSQLVNNSNEPIQLHRHHIFSFGSPVAIRNTESSWRFDTKRDVGIYLGPSVGSVGGGLVYFPSTGSILARGDLIHLDIQPAEFERYSNNRLTIRGDSKDDHFIIQQADASEDTNKLKPEPPILSKRQTKAFIRKLLTRSVSKANAQLSALSTQLQKANDLELALNGPEGHYWNTALLEEVNSLFYSTETIIEEIPSPNTAYDVIYVTVVLKKKMRDEVNVDKYKVRICACGNQLRASESETYSPTVSSLVHSLLLQLSITDRMSTATFDTISAYLHQHYPQDTKPLYLRFPKVLAKTCGLDPNALYRVRKYLYGLPDAGRAYYVALSQHLRDHGYIQSASDPCLFYHLDQAIGIRTLIWFHVDDLFCSSTHPDEIPRLHNVLKLRFPVKMNLSIDAHLGITMTKGNDDSLLLTQPKLLHEVLKYCGDETPTKYPSLTRRTISNHESKQISSTKYLELLGKLLYLTNTRPEIIPNVSYSATKSVSPTEDDYDELLQIVRFLKGTPGEGLRLYPGSRDNKLKIIAYVDAAYLSHNDGSSHTGYTIGLTTGSTNPKSFFHSKSQKQKLIATSSTHAEIRALYQLTTTLIFIYNLFREIEREIELPILVYEDNQATIHLTQNIPSAAAKSKHFLMLSNFIRQQVQIGLISLEKIASNKNIANVLTKLITSPEFQASFNQIKGIWDEQQMNTE